MSTYISVEKTDTKNQFSVHLPLLARRTIQTIDPFVEISLNEDSTTMEDDIEDTRRQRRWKQTVGFYNSDFGCL